MITKEEYDQYAIDGFNVIPLIKKIDVVSDSPIKIYSKIKNKENTFLLESIEGGDRGGRRGGGNKNNKNRNKNRNQNKNLNKNKKPRTPPGKWFRNKITTTGGKSFRRC